MRFTQLILSGFAAVCMFMGPVAMGSASASPANAKKEYKKGVEAGNAGKIGDAIQAFRAALREDPTMFKAALDLGQAYKIKRRYPEALAAYTVAAQLEPESAKAIKGLAGVYSALDAPALALEQYETMLTMEKDKPTIPTLTLIGEAQLDSEKYDAAIETFNKVIGMKNDDVNATVKIGEAHYRKGAYEKAIQSFTTATNIDAKSSAAWYGIGLAHDKAGKADEAKKAIDKACELGNKGACKKAKSL